MAYGFKTKALAESKAAALREQEPDNKFEVTPHSWKQREYSRLANGEINEDAAETWGVVRWVPYCEEVPWRNTGFVWF